MAFRLPITCSCLDRSDARRRGPAPSRDGRGARMTAFLPVRPVTGNPREGFRARSCPVVGHLASPWTVPAPWRHDRVTGAGLTLAHDCGAGHISHGTVFIACRGRSQAPRASRRGGRMGAPHVVPGPCGHLRRGAPRRGVRLDRVPVAAGIVQGVRAHPGAGAAGRRRAALRPVAGGVPAGLRPHPRDRRDRPVRDPVVLLRGAHRGRGRAPRGRRTTCCSTTSATPAGGQRFFATMPLRRRVDAVLAVASSLDRGRAGRRCARWRCRWPPSAARCPASPGSGSTTGPAPVMAVRHLVLLGHRDIVMISGEPDDPVGRATTAARAGRLRGRAGRGRHRPAPTG